MSFSHLQGHFICVNPKPPSSHRHFVSIPQLGQAAPEDLVTYQPNGDSRGRTAADAVKCQYLDAVKCQYHFFNRMADTSLVGKWTKLDSKEFKMIKLKFNHISICI